MKKIVSIVLSLIMVLSLSAGLDFSAYADSTSNGFTYIASSGYAIITGYNNKNIDVLNIPSKIYDAESGKDLTLLVSAKVLLRATSLCTVSLCLTLSPV